MRSSSSIAYLKGLWTRASTTDHLTTLEPQHPSTNKLCSVSEALIEGLWGSKTLKGPVRPVGLTLCSSSQGILLRDLTMQTVYFIDPDRPFQNWRSRDRQVLWGSRVLKVQNCVRVGRFPTKIRLDTREYVPCSRNWKQSIGFDYGNFMTINDSSKVVLCEDCSFTVIGMYKKYTST